MRDAGYKVVITGEGSDEILGGYAHFRRDMLIYNRDGPGSRSRRDAARRTGALNPVSRGLLLPDGESRPLDHVKRRLGFIPSWMETFSARAAKLRRAVLADDFLRSVRDRARAIGTAAERARRARPAAAAAIRCTSRCISGPRPACQATF